MKKTLNSFLFYFLYGLCYLVSLLPLRALYALSTVIYFFVYHLLRYRRRVVRRNLVGSFPEKSLQEIVSIERKFYELLCDYFFDSVKLASMSRKEVTRRMRFEGFDRVLDLTRQGKSAVVYLSHTFNWEWITSLPLAFPEGEAIAFGQIYHVLENEVFDRLFLRLRGRFGTVSIPMRMTMRKMLEYRRDGIPFVIGFIADQVPLYQATDHWLDFFHRDTPVITGAEKLAKGMNCAVFYCTTTSSRRGYYTCKAELLSEGSADIPDYELTDIYFKRLEEDIRQNPSYWLWSHNRWKRTREGFLKFEERQREKQQRSKMKE